MNINPAQKLAKRAMAQIGMLSAQLLLGMAVNLIGLPKEVNGSAKVATTSFLILHIGIGIGLLIGSLMAVKLARKVNSHFVRDAWIGVLLVVTTFVVGVLTMILGNNWLSYIMTVGFLASFLLYGAMFVYAGRQSYVSKSNFNE
ncbi:MAG TPA: hypothetical protein VLG16_05195 [Candidatus Saccharimonadales bacterium]|nr:hypothetical protein [Candidatus Saccharimonadales bacterium]